MAKVHASTPESTAATVPQSYAQMSVQLLGLKMLQLAKLPEDSIGREIIKVLRDGREILITMGLRKRKTFSRRNKK